METTDAVMHCELIGTPLHIARESACAGVVGARYWEGWIGVKRITQRSTRTLTCSSYNVHGGLRAITHHILVEVIELT